MFSKKVSIIIGVIVIAIIGSNLLLLIFENKPKTAPIIVFPTPTSIQNIIPKLTGGGSVLYKKGSPQKLEEKIKNRQSLSINDTALKKGLVASSDNGTKDIYTSSSFRIFYVTPFDMLQVELLSSDITVAKYNATAWLKEQGLSETGICNFPIMFYINAGIKSELARDIEFNVLPDGCEL